MGILDGTGGPLLLSSTGQGLGGGAQGQGLGPGLGPGRGGGGSASGGGGRGGGGYTTVPHTPSSSSAVLSYTPSHALLLCTSFGFRQGELFLLDQSNIPPHCVICTPGGGVQGQASNIDLLMKMYMEVAIPNPINTSFQYTLSIHIINASYQYILSMHPINTHYQCILSKSYQHTLSTHPINNLSIHLNNTPYQHNLSTHLLTTTPYQTTYLPTNPSIRTTTNRTSCDYCAGKVDVIWTYVPVCCTTLSPQIPEKQKKGGLQKGQG